MTPQRFRTIRTRLNLSQARLAEALGLAGGANYISRMERGRAPISRPIATHMALIDLVDGTAEVLAMGRHAPEGK